MSTKKIDDYAFKHAISNNEAKRRLKGRRGEGLRNLPVRGMAVAGTGKAARKPGGK